MVVRALVPAALRVGPESGHELHLRPAGQLAQRGQATATTDVAATAAGAPGNEGDERRDKQDNTRYAEDHAASVGPAAIVVTAGLTARTSFG